MKGAIVTQSAVSREAIIPWICTSCRAARHNLVPILRASSKQYRNGQQRSGVRAHTTSRSLKESSHPLLSGRPGEPEQWTQRSGLWNERHPAGNQIDAVSQSLSPPRLIQRARDLELRNNALDPASLLSELRTADSGQGNGVRSRTDKVYGQNLKRAAFISRTSTQPSIQRERMDSGFIFKGAPVDPQNVKWNTIGMADHEIAFITSLLCRFHPSINLTQTRAIFLELQAFTAKPQNPRAPPLIYERLITTYLNLRNPAGAIEVYNAFVKAGHEPTLRTYAILMRGATKGRDMKALQAFWEHLRKSRMNADAHIWSILIFGLIRAGRVEEGVQALETMGVEWIQAARAEHRTARAKGRAKKGSTHSGSELSAADLVAKFTDPLLADGTARPTTVVMNTAIAALASRKPSLVPKVLTWGRQFALEPNRTTYNYMLNMSMRQGKSDDAIAILKLMENQSIGTDSGTWTVVLRAWFDSGVLLPLSEDEVETKVFGFIDSIRGELHSRVNEQGYAIIINAFLKDHGSAHLAQRTIEHMISSGLRPTAYIYTMLATYFFQNPKTFGPRVSNGSANGPQQENERRLCTDELETIDDQILDDQDWRLPPDDISPQGSSSTPRSELNATHENFAIDTSGEFTPDYASLAALWTHITSSGTKGVGLDAVFFDRVIEGYSIHHRTSPDRSDSSAENPSQKRNLDTVQPGFLMVWPALRLMGSIGLQPSWRALESLIRALAERGEWHDFRRIVEKARRRVKISQGSGGVSRRFQQARDEVQSAGSSVAPTSAFGQISFWEFVISTGYLEQEGVARAEDIMLALNVENSTTDSRLASIARGG